MDELKQHLKTLPGMSLDELQAELQHATDEICNARYAAQLARRGLAEANVRFSEVKAEIGRRVKVAA